MRALTCGECVVCLQPYSVGDEVGLLVDGWAQLECYELVLATTAMLEQTAARGGKR